MTKNAIGIVRTQEGATSEDKNTRGMPEARKRGRMQYVVRESSWLQVHEHLVMLARKRAGLDWEEGEYLLRAFDSSLHVRLGYGSFVEYVERLFGHSPRLTMEKIRVAKALADLPEMSRELRGGKITWSAVRELTRVAVPETEQKWLEASAKKSVREVERLVSGHVLGNLPDAPKDPKVERHVMRFDVRAETRATFNEALAKLTRDAGQHLDDDALLLLMARAVLGGPTDEGRASYQVTMTVCERCSGGTQTGKGEVTPVDRAVVEMARCDAQEVPDAHVGVGKRAAQSIPPAVRRLVMQRDSGRCCVPGCRHSIFVDVHHIDPRAENGGHEPEKSDGVVCRASSRVASWVVGGGGSAGDGVEVSTRRWLEVRQADVGGSCRRERQGVRCPEKHGLSPEDARAAVERANAHVGSEASTESLLRRALAELTP
jgi:hypothetical protein